MRMAKRALSATSDFTGSVLQPRRETFFRFLLERTSKWMQTRGEDAGPAHSQNF